MKIRLRISGSDDPDAALMKIAGASAVAHVLGLVIFSVLPRFMTAPAPRPTLVGEIVPASSFMPAPRPSAPVPKGPTPSERADAARRARQEKQAREEPPPAAPKPKPPSPKKDPTIPPLEPRREPRKPEKPPEPESRPPAAVDQTQEPPADQGPPDPGNEAPSTFPAETPGGVTFGNPGGPDGGVPSIGSSAFPYDYYRSSLMTLLQSNWRRPVAPNGLVEPLRCAVGFTILKTGIVKDAHILEPSGNSGLDRSALRAVIDSSPLPPLPFQYGHGAVGAVVFFELTSD